MKKFVLGVFVVLLAVVLISCRGADGAQGPAGPAGKDGTNGKDATEIPSNATILVNQNFDSYAVGVTPTGWSRAPWTNLGPEVYHPVTNTAYLSYNKCLMVQAFTYYEWGREIVESPFVNPMPSTITGKVYINFYVNKPVTNKAKGFVFYANNYEKARVNFDETGHIAVHYNYDLLSVIKVDTYEANKWYFVKIIVDLAANTYDLYINNLLKIAGIPCYNFPECSIGNSQVPPIFQLYHNFFGIFTNFNDNYLNDVVYIDNVLIYYVP
jgi:hypothetical protein